MKDDDLDVKTEEKIAKEIAKTYNFDLYYQFPTRTLESAVCRSCRYTIRAKDDLAIPVTDRMVAHYKTKHQWTKGGRRD